MSGPGHGSAFDTAGAISRGMRLLAAGLLLCSLPLSVASAQTADPIPVITLGTFHFNFPNLDARRIDAEDQIDVLEPQYQEEIEGIVRDLARFKPTIIVIERRLEKQHATDSAFEAYREGKYALSRGEDEQIGFRLAKLCGAGKLWCVDEWGVFTDSVGAIVEGKDSAEAARFETYYFHNPDSLKKTAFKPSFKSEGLRKELAAMNDAGRVRKSLGDYLIGIFKYERSEGDFLGVDFETGRWFNRNLRIYRNIQRIPASSGDRILVIFGAGHMNLLNYFFECSPEYRLENLGDYLK